MPFARIRIEPRRRRWPWAAVALAALAAGVGTALRQPPVPSAPSAPSAPMSVQIPLRVVTPMPAEAAPAPPARRVAAAVPAPRRATAPEPAAAEVSQACSASAGADPADPRGRWLATLQASADERQRAAGWLIGIVDAPEGSGALRDRLATLAATSRDPLVQAYAWRACRGDAALSSACQALAPEAWARLEPDNAAAWLAVAADPRVEPAAQLDALRQAARSSRLDSHAPALHALARAAQPAGVGDLERVMMARDIVEARADWLGTEALRFHCSAAALGDAALGPTCEAIASLLAAKAQSLPDLLEARETGQRAGWGAERLVALRDEEQALAALDRQRFEAPADLNCAALARQDAFYADVGRLGEVGALREALQRADQTNSPPSSASRTVSSSVSRSSGLVR